MIIFNGLDPGNPFFFSGQLCHLANNFSLSCCALILVLRIDKQNTIDRFYIRIYCLTPSMQDFRDGWSLGSLQNRGSRCHILPHLPHFAAMAKADQVEIFDRKIVLQAWKVFKSLWNLHWSIRNRNSNTSSAAELSPTLSKLKDTRFSFFWKYS